MYLLIYKNHDDYQRERGWSEVEKGKGVINGDGRTLDLWW